MEYGKHYSVFYKECVEAFKQSSQGLMAPCFADMTFGAGGHSIGIAKEIKNAKVYAVDQDPDAIKNGNIRIEEENLKNNVFLNKMNFESFPKWIENNHPELKFSGILMDLGVSSHQFDTKDRGFSFRREAKLDMRMAYDDDTSVSAYEVINDFEEQEIASILYKYGEEKLSRRIAKEIIEKRKIAPIESTTDLENIIFHCYPKNQRFGKTHPATRSFQALRIFVNRELEVLENTLEKLFNLLEMEGKLAIISFHSLEDRIVKHKFKDIFQNNKNFAKIITKKPILPSEEELEENSRSRSAKLRIIQRTHNTMEGNKYGHKKKKDSG